MGAAVAATEDSATALQSLHQPWQALAFGYYGKIGECWNPAQFYARSMSKLNVYMGELGEDGEIAPTENPTVNALFEPMQRAAKGEGGLLASYGRLKFLIGEGRLCQSRPPESQDGNSASLPPVWEFLSPTELAVRDQGRMILRKSSDQGQGIEYENISDLDGAGDPEPGQMRMWRLWRRHPQFSQQADSPVRAVLDLYEQLWWVTMGERSDIQSRIANAGLLLIPREIDLEQSEQEEQATSEDPEADPFMVRVADLMTTAIGDPGSAAAVTPGIIRADAELLKPDVFRLLKFYEPGASLFASQREEALIKRISIGLDLPIEEVMGLSQANHWTAWKIDDEKWAHIEPVAQGWCDDMFAAVMRPLLVANGIDDPDRYPVMYDNTDLVTDPDKGKTAIVLHKDGVLKASTTLEVNGFDPDEDLMTGEEKDEWLALQMRSPEMLGFEVEEPEEPAAPGAEEEEEEPEAEEEPDTEDEQDEEPVVPIAAANAELRGVAEFAVDRARELAGAKVRSLKRSCEECFAGLEDVPNRNLVAALGPERLEQMGAPAPNRLVAGAVASFLATCDRLGYRVTPELAHAIEEHAAASLFSVTPPPLSEELIATLGAA